MKLVLAHLLLFILVLTAACHHPVNPEQNDPGNVHYTADLSQAQQWFRGKWKLTAVTAMIPNPPVPNVCLVVDKSQVTVIQDGKQTDSVNFELIRTASGFQLKTDAQPREDNWYVRNPGLRVSSDRLFLNTGGSEENTFSFRRIE